MLSSQSSKAITILGIDPGLRNTGYGVIRKDGNNLATVAYGVISSGEGALPERLGRIFQELTLIINEYKPDCACIEIVFVNVNFKSSLALGQARGVAISALTNYHLPITEITALQIKQSVVGYGKATKEQINKMVMTLLKIENGIHLKHDAADALACAISYAFLMPTNKINISPNVNKQNSTLVNNPNLELFKQQSRRKRKTSRWTSADLNKNN